MRQERWVVVALVVTAFLIGGLAWAMTGPAASDGSGSEEVTVPTGRIGDRVQYESFLRGPGDDEWTPVSRWGLSVDGVREGPDQNAVNRSMLDVTWNAKAGQEEYGALVGNTTLTWSSGFVASIDLASGRPIQTKTLIDISYADYPLPFTESNYDQGFTFYGPDFPPDYTRLAMETGQIPMFLAAQGDTYQVGQEISSSETHFLDGQWLMHPEYSWSIQPPAVVSGPAQIEERETFKFATSGCMALEYPLDMLPRFGQSAGLAWAHGVENPHPSSWFAMLHAYVPHNADVCFDADVWVSEASAYPVLYQERVVVNGTEVYEWSDVLVDVEPGSEPIPWTTDETPGPTEPPEPERSPDGHPTDGSAYRFSYSVEAALDAIYSDVGLSEFNAWRQDGPEAFILGGVAWAYNTGCTDRPWTALDSSVNRYTWDFLFGKTSGEYFHVRSALDPTGLLGPENCAARMDDSPYAPHRFDSGRLPKEPVTLTYIDEQWRQSTGYYADASDARLGWGWGFACGTSSWGCDAADFRIYPQWRLDGSLGGWACDDVSCKTGDYKWESVTVDLETGALVRSSVTDGRTGHTFALADIAGGAPPQPTAQASVDGDAPPAITLLAAGGSLLALLLLAYLYPSIKYHGTGLLMAVPGYAKLSKDKVLENPTREQILDRIRADPGVSPPEIHKTIDAGWTTVVYHLRVLEKNGLISSLIDGRHKRIFPNDSIDWSQRGELAALKNDRTKEIYHLLLEEPGLRRRELAKRVGVTPNAIDWHIERLQAASLAGIDKDGRAHRIYANPTAVTPPQGMEIA